MVSRFTFQSDLLSIWEADVGTVGRDPQPILNSVRLSNEQRKILLNA